MKALKDLYFDELNDLYQKFILKCQQQDALVQTQMRSDLIDKLRNFGNALKTTLTYLTIPKNGISPGQNAGIPTSQQNMQNVLQSGSHMDSTQANNLVAVQQPKNLKRSCSLVMGKEKKCRMSCAVEEENLCAICLDPVMDNGDRSTAKLRCSHQFHLGN
ncbi:hypothetical protein EJ110_NYTH59337 [Nymphaea thermarum]|nr:hypothetical protein EJ110_NYTH59337 [Nymphaea thermarum]